MDQAARHIQDSLTKSSQNAAAAAVKATQQAAAKQMQIGERLAQAQRRMNASNAQKGAVGSRNLPELNNWAPAQNAAQLLQQKLASVNEQLEMQRQKLQSLSSQYAALSNRDMGTAKEQMLAQSISQVQARMISLQSTAQSTQRKLQQLGQAPVASTSRLTSALQRVRGVLVGLGGGASKVMRTLVQGLGNAARSAGRFTLGMRRSATGVQSFGARLRSIVGGALIFNVLSSALSGMVQYFKSATMASGEFRTALANLKGAASTAVAPLIQMLTPALTAIANAAATAFSYVARLISLLTGKSVSSMQASARATNQYAKSASGAAKSAEELAEANNTLGIDELNVIQPNQKQEDSSGGSGGSGEAVAPNFDFQGKSPFLDSVLDAIKAGDYYQVGALFADKLNESLASINWGKIQSTVRRWMNNLVETINGFIENLDWNLVGKTIGEGLNTAIIVLDRFWQGVNWQALGAGLGNGLNSMIQTVEWGDLGRSLGGKIQALLETLHGFVQTFDWASLGQAVAWAFNGAVNSIDWVQAMRDLGDFAIGLMQSLQNAIQGIDWAGIGQTAFDMIAAIDWGGILSNLVQLITELVVAAFQLLGAFIIESIRVQGEQISTYFTDIGENGIQGFFNGMWNLLCDIGTWLYDHLIAPLVNGVKEMLGIHSPSTVFAEIGEYLVLGLFEGLSRVWGIITGFFTEKIEWIKTFVLNGWNSIRENTLNVWGKIASWLGSTWDNIQSKCGAAWDALSDKTRDVWDSIVSWIKGAVNGIIGLMNGMIGAVETAVNDVVDAINGIGFTNPFTGEHIGFDLPRVGFGRIPMLANGGVIGQPTLAMMGEYAGASSNPEIAAPESKLRELFGEGMAPMLDVLQYIAQLLSEQERQELTISQPLELKLDGQVLYRAMAKIEANRGVKIGGAFANAY